MASAEAGDSSMPIAIIGMGCRFPGDASNPEKFWEMLTNGRAAWSEIPPERFNIDAYYHPSAERGGAVSLA
jgi:acyl transferase domain-containing protein